MQSNKYKINPKREERFLLSISCWCVFVAVTETFTEREEFRLVESGKQEETSHPEEVFVAVFLVPLPVCCRLVTVINA